MAAAASAASPILLGLSVNDPLYQTTVGQHRQRLAASELQSIADLDQAVVDAEAALQWLETYIIDELVSEHELRQATGEGRPLAELTSAEKARRVQAGIERGDPDLRQSLYTPASGESAPDPKPLTSAQVAAFARKPVADKVAAGERGAAKGLSPAEIIAGDAA